TDTFNDNRARIEVDPKQIETWELMVMEAGVVANWILVFSRYLKRGDKLISPSLPNEPIDFLGKAELAQIKNSDAYKMLIRFKTAEIAAAARSFSEQAASGF
ncbi:MAG: hypothetical protein GY799_28375, partial [Desulfobulbaceae bacterium]|nr:hypothetical protein [Desulfobulbaceae bacterium]